MPEIPLTQGQVAIVDQEDLDRLNQFKWSVSRCVLKGRIKYYARRGTTKLGKHKTILMHREILKIPGHIDHKDGNGLNNQKSNLRPSTRQQNGENREKTPGTSSQYKGVSWDKSTNKWLAEFTVNYFKKHLGRFNNEKEAAIAYNEAAKKYFGEFARPNIIC